MMQQVLLNLNADASYQALRDLRNLLEQTLVRLNCNQQLINKQLTVFSECATNFVEHSHGISKIGINLAIQHDQIALQCSGFSSNNEQQTLQTWLDQTDNETADSILEQLDPLRSGGRGAALVHNYADKIKILASYIDSNLQAITSTESNPVGSPSSNSVPIHPNDGNKWPPLWCNAIEFTWPMQTRVKRSHILIVEDDLAQNTLYCAYLSPHYHITSVGNVTAAMQHLSVTHFDLVLSDIHFPQHDGIYLKQQLRDTAIPFIFMSADNEASTLNTIRELGIDDFISKPFVKQQLLDSIEQVLIRAKQLSQNLDKEWHKTISQALSPQLPQHLANWTTALRSEGPRQGGGDFVLNQQVGDECFIVVADLMGHNVASKFFAHAYMGYMRGLLAAFKTQQAQVFNDNKDHVCSDTSALPAPNVFLNALSQALHSDALLSSTMCTCCAIRLRKNQHIDIASAGHPLPWLITDKAISPLPLNGMLPGLVEDLVYDCYSFTLNANERLAIYTDGLTEAPQRSDKSANDARAQSVQQALLNSQTQSIEQALTGVFNSLTNEAGTTEYTDDTLLLLIEPSVSSK